MARLYLAEQSALAVGGHYFAYSRCVALAARRAGLDVTILQNHAFEGDWDVEGAEIVSAFRHTWSEAEALWIREWGPGHIAWDMREATASRPPVAGDQVLFTTLGAAEMRALLDYLIELPAGFDHPTYHLLLRYDPAGIRAELDHYKPLFDRVAGSALLRRVVRFHTDTDLLSADYADLFGSPFTTLPIPFDQTVLTQQLAKRRAPGPLVITYLGDARLEKGFAGIPAAVAALWDDYVVTGKVRFVIQSNFNVPGGETGMLQAVQKLGQYPPTMVEMIDHPMQGDAYAERLAQADILIIPYDAARYRSRSSGILIEAMAAGKPVVTTRSSWMATQVDPSHAVLMDGADDLGAALKAAIDGYPALKKGAARLAPAALAHSSADHFIREVIASATSGPKGPAVSAPRVLVIVDGDALVLRNGFGLVAMNQFRYLASTGYRVCALVLNGRREATPGAIETWSNAIRERLSGFDLDAVLVAGAGRLSFDVLRQQHGTGATDPSIGRDMERAQGYDVSLDAVDFLRRHAIDAVLLNGVVNWPLVERLGLADVPVVCETHDVQSFQKAIYGKRRLLQSDLDTEQALLARCRHLISLSPSETAYLGELLPDAHITTVSIFPPLPDLGVRTLAGAETIAEIVSTCGPVLEIYKGGDLRHARRSADASPLGDVERLDLVYVSSNHAANVSGLRWFLETVYLPHLAPAGVTFAVAGSISDWEWPTHENLFVLGRLKDLDPLYAAARAVILPITEGAGAAVKTIEALTFGRPVVATSIAMRGMEGSVGGVTIADTPEQMVEAIQTLLASESLQDQQALASRRSGWALADPRAYARALDAVFKDVLGKRALRSSVALPALPDHVEPWGDRLRAVNHVARRWLEDEALDAGVLTRLAGYPADTVLPLLREVLTALVIDRDAFCLSSEPHVLVAAASRTPDDVERFCAVVETTLRAVAPDAGDATGGSIQIVCEAALPIEATVVDGSGDWTLERFGAAPVSTSGKGRVSLELASAPSARADFDRIVLSKGKSFAASTIVVSQSIPLDGAYRPRGQGAVIETGEREASVARLKAGDSVQLTLPELYSPTPAVRLVELQVEASGALEIDAVRAGKSLRGRHFRDGMHHIVRFELEAATASVTVSVDVVSGNGVLHAVRNLLAFPADGEALFDPAGMQIVPDAADPGGPARPVFSRGLDPVMALARAGLALPRYRMLALKTRLAQERGDLPADAVPADLQLNEADARNLLALVEPGAASDAHWIASAGLTVEVAADFPDIGADAAIVCRIDGGAAELVRQSGTERVWRRSGEAQGAREPWRRAAAFTIEATRTRKAMRWRKPRRFILRRLLRVLGVPRKQYEKWLDATEFDYGEARAASPAAASAIYRFEAALDPATDNRFARLSNAHEPEGGSMVWTGPGKTSVFTLPLALTAPGVLEIGFANLGVNVGLDDIDVDLNGVPLRMEMSRTGDDPLLRAAFPADADAVATTELRIQVRRVGQLGGDHRNLGVALTFIQFALAL